jgi:hypothetical protein
MSSGVRARTFSIEIFPNPRLFFRLSFIGLGVGMAGKPPNPPPPVGDRGLRYRTPSRSSVGESENAKSLAKEVRAL